MKKLLTLILFGAGVCSVQALTPVGGDDFNDNTVDPAWVPLFTSSGVAFSEINQRLEFTGTGGFVGWNWTSNTLSAAEDWAIAIDLVYSVDPSVQASGEETSLQFEVEAGGTDAFQIKYFLKDGGFYLLTQHGDNVTDIGYGLDYRNISTNQISVRIDYDASAETISASYDDGSGFTTTTNYSVSSWGLSPSSTFLPLVSVDHETIPFSSGDAYFDNFQVYGEDAQPVTDEDDFNDNSMNTSQWAVSIWQEGNGFLSETNSRLEYSNLDGSDTFTSWDWTKGGMPATQSWAIAVDAATLIDPLSLTDDLSLGFFAYSADYSFEMELEVDPNETIVKYFSVDLLSDTDLTNVIATISGTALTMTIVYDVEAQMFHSYYDAGAGHVRLGSYSTTAWGLSASDTFNIGVYGEGTVIIPPGSAWLDNFIITRGISVVDVDDDGLPDEWEIQYWGSIGHPHANPEADPDSDGIGNGGAGRNWAEWIMGTDPTNANSILKLAQPWEIPGEGFVIDWQSVSGRVYTVEWTDHLTNSFQTLETGITHPQNSYTDTVHNAESGGFYNLKVNLKH